MKYCSNMLKVISFSVLLFGVFVNANGSGLENKKKYEEQFLDRILILENFISLANPTLIDIDDKEYDEDGRLHFFRIRKDGGQPVISGFTVSPNFKVRLTWEGDRVSKAQCISAECEDEVADYKIINGLPSSRSGFTLFPDENGVVIKGGDRNSRSYGSIGKKQWQKTFYEFHYFPSGKLKSIREMVTIGKGKNVRDITPVFDYCFRERKFYEDDPQKIELTTYKRLFKKRDDPRKSINVWVICKREDNEIYTYSKIKSFSLKGFRIASDTVKWSLNEDNQPIQIEKSTSRFLMNYNENNFVSKVKIFSGKNGGVEKLKEESLYSYTPKEDTDNTSPCMYDRHVLRKYYEDGTVIREDKDGYARFRNDDGSWSEWKFLPY